MRVGIDGASFGNRRGFGRFARNAVGRLLELDTETDYAFVLDRRDPALETLPDRAERVLVDLSEPPAEAAGASSNRRPRDLARMSRAARRERFDAFLFPSLHTWFPRCGAPTLVGLHDTITDDYAGLTAARRRDRMLLRAKQSLAVRSAAQLFTVSAASRDAISAQLGIAAERLPIVPEAPDPVFRAAPSAEAVARVRQRVGLAPGVTYVLYAGGISPHKNVETLVDGFALAAIRVDTPLFLVLVGALGGDETFVSSAAAVRERIASRGVEERVLLPGFVSDEDLAALYAGALAVALPSLAEGFGLPAVEAAAAGTAVVLSDIPPHRETLGAAALFFPPTDREALARHLTALARDRPARDEVARACRTAVEALTWDHAATELEALLRRAAALA